MDVIGKIRLYLVKVVVFRQKWLYSDKLVVIGQSGCIRVKMLYSAKLVKFGHNWL